MENGGYTITTTIDYELAKEWLKSLILKKRPRKRKNTRSYK
jgi:hypothetical protein